MPAAMVTLLIKIHGSYGIHTIYIYISINSFATYFKKFCPISFA